MKRGAVVALVLASGCFGAPTIRTEAPPPSDATARLQALLDAAEPGSVVRIPAGEYRCRNLVLADVTDVEVRGDGVTIAWDGVAEAGARVGIELRGDVRRVRIAGLHLVGDGVIASRHAGVWSRSGQRIEDVEIVENTIEDVTLGISVNADLGGHLARIRIVSNRILDVVGTDPGWGYGIHVASGQADPLQLVVAGNTIRGAQRHAIYQARGRGAEISGNRVLDHRADVANGALRPAIVVARSSDVRVVGNVVRGHADGGIVVTTGNAPTARIALVGNVVTDARNAVPSIVVGSQDPSREGSPSEVTIEGNRVVHGDARGEALRVYGVEGLRVADNVLVAGRALPRSPAIGLRCACPIVLERNVLD